MGDRGDRNRTVICEKCGEPLWPRGNCTYQHAPQHLRPRGHRHRPLAVFAEPDRAKPVQFLFELRPTDETTR